jgi:hypothetical protein
LKFFLELARRFGGGAADGADASGGHRVNLADGEGDFALLPGEDFLHGFDQVGAEFSFLLRHLVTSLRQDLRH